MGIPSLAMDEPYVPYPILVFGRVTARAQQYGQWRAVVSTPVFKMMKDEGFGFMYKTNIEGKQLHFVVYSFVDDTDIIQSGQPGEPFQILAMRMQAAMDTWEGGLRATGGAFEPEK
jgi:hypothetical protein